LANGAGTIEAAGTPKGAFVVVAWGRRLLVGACLMGGSETIWHVVLQTSRAEIAENCAEPLASRVEAAAERLIARMAARAGELIMGGTGYWSALPLAAAQVLGDLDASQNGASTPDPRSR
jgi:hypothetical protein